MAVLKLAGEFSPVFFVYTLKVYYILVIVFFDFLHILIIWRYSFIGYLFYFIKKGGENMLTPKQEKFCQCIVSGMTGKDAYFTAYDSSGSDQNAYNEASKLLLREDIQNRIKSLIKPIEDALQVKQLSEREQIKQILQDRLKKAIEREDDNIILKITDQINRMNAEYINVNRNIEDKATEIDLLDAETLKRLAEA